MKEYIVVVRPDVDLDRFWAEMENHTHGCGCVPDRAVDIAHNRSMFRRICEYWLTEAEAEVLRNDSRVLSVEVPVRNNPNVTVVPGATQNIAGMNYTKQPGASITIDYTTGSNIGNTVSYTSTFNASTNWGLVRHSSVTNPYNQAGITSSVYNYVLDGSGVDVIINDTGIQADHPEFAGRIPSVNWNSIAATVGASTTFDWNTASYTDTDGHGTNVAGIAAGATYGWAKGANIIPLVISFLGQSSAEPLDMFEMMIYWHQTKGTNNPTVVNMSWNLRLNFNQGVGYYAFIDSGVYRGTPWSGAQTNSFYQSRGLIALTNNGISLQGDPVVFPYSSTAYNEAMSEVIDAGIIVCQAAGNNGFKFDAVGGDDYDNYVVSSALGTSNPFYYHRGASPTDSRAIVVGALDTVTQGLKDKRAQYSVAGPGVDIWAAGTTIMSAGVSNPAVNGTQYRATYSPYYLNQNNQNYNEFYCSGTSQAAPQITGMSALYLQINPPGNIYDANNSSNVKSWLISNAITNSFYSTGNATTYTDATSLLGGLANVAYQPIQGLTWIKTDSSTWTLAANVFVKTANATWSNADVSTKTSTDQWKPVFAK